MTNLLVLAFGLATNSISAVVVGDRGVGAVITHIQIEQRAVIGFRKRGKSFPLGTNTIVVQTLSTTNFLPLIQAPRPAPVRPATVPKKLQPTNAPPEKISEP